MLEGVVGEVGCFGKLPLSPEFIRVNAKGSTLEAYDQWVQEGLLWCREKLGARWRDHFLQSEPWNFLFQLPQNNECLIGVMMPSQDKAGRGFPMILFFRIENFPNGQKCIPMLPLLLQEFLEKARSLLQEEWKKFTLVEFREEVRKLVQTNSLKLEQVSELYHEFLTSYSLKDYLRMCGVSTLRLTDSEVKGMVQTLVLENHHSPPSPSEHFMSFPMINEPAFPFEIPFWMEYVYSIHGRRMTAPILFWNKCPSKGRAALLTQDAPMAPKDFWTLLHSDTDLESVWKMDSMDEGDVSLKDEPLNADSNSLNLKDHTLNGLVLGQPN